MVFEWATSGPYAGGTVDFIETYQGYDIYFLSHWGLLAYGIVDPSGVELDTFAGTLEAARLYIDSLLEADIPTTLTINAPASVEPDETFSITGILYETETGLPLPNQIIDLSYNGVILGSALTGVDGDYLIQAFISTEGTYTLLASFAGTTTLGASQATSRLTTGGLELTALLPILVVGAVALIAFKGKKK